MRAIGLTDIHLGFLGERAVSAFLRELSRWNADAALISGDIAQASTVSEYLSKLAKFLEFPIYFVLA
jgi:3',5'-cyclic AMP phosphodiesterase CpdA